MCMYVCVAYCVCMNVILFFFLNNMISFGYVEKKFFLRSKDSSQLLPVDVLVIIYDIYIYVCVCLCLCVCV